MFAFAEGLLDDLNMDSCVVDVGGFGVNVNITSKTALRLPGIGEHVKLYTHTSVREDGISLYGFDEPSDLKLFKLLITVTGVGPKGALGILSSMESDDIRMAIISEDVKALSKAQGIGPKTASRIVLDLKDKLKDTDITLIGRTSEDVRSTAEISLTGQMEDAVSALTALGYSATESRKTVSSVAGAENMDSGEILSAALKILY